MANLTSLDKQQLVEENKPEQVNEIFDSSNDNSESESSTSPIFLILYAVITMSIVLFLFK